MEKLKELGRKRCSENLPVVVVVVKMTPFIVEGMTSEVGHERQVFREQWMEIVMREGVG